MSDHDASASGADTKREEGDAATSAGEGQVVVVTGGNKGIGFEVCRQVAVAWPTADVILASRDQGRGEAAVATLKADGVTNVRFLATLDVGSAESVAAFAAALAVAVPRVDVLVNNAGVFVVRHRMRFHAFPPTLLSTRASRSLTWAVPLYCWCSGRDCGRPSGPANSREGSERKPPRYALPRWFSGARVLALTFQYRHDGCHERSPAVVAEIAPRSHRQVCTVF